MHHAELARVLHLQCRDIGALANGKTVLDEDSASWAHVLAFLNFYQNLYSHFEGDGVAMCNWLRRDHPEFNKTPLLVMVDDLRIESIIRLLTKLFVIDKRQDEYYVFITLFILLHQKNSIS